MALSAYERVKRWRKKHPGASKEWRTQRRRHFRRLWLKGKIAYDDIPASYRYWKQPR